MEIDVRLTVQDAVFTRGLSSEEVEAELLDDIVNFVLEPCCVSAVILRNDGYSNLVPDEDSRRNRE